MVFYPRDPRIANLLERFTQNNTIVANSKVARELCKYSDIRKLREKDLMLIGKDHRKDISIIFLKKQIRKKGNGFIL